MKDLVQKKVTVSSLALTHDSQAQHGIQRDLWVNPQSFQRWSFAIYEKQAAAEHSRWFAEVGGSKSHQFLIHGCVFVLFTLPLKRFPSEALEQRERCFIVWYYIYIDSLHKQHEFICVDLFLYFFLNLNIYIYIVCFCLNIYIYVNMLFCRLPLMGLLPIPKGSDDSGMPCFLPSRNWFQPRNRPRWILQREDECDLGWDGGWEWGWPLDEMLKWIK